MGLPIPTKLCLALAVSWAGGCATTSPCKPCPVAVVKKVPAKQPTKPGRVPGPLPTPAKSPPPPKWAGQLSGNCQAKLAFSEEVSRLLLKAAAHATSSAACIDGSGTRVVVDEVLVCPGPSRGGRTTFYARYRVTRTGEGDTRMCGRGPNDCAWTRPVATTHYAALVFVGVPGGKRLEIPKPKMLSGLSDATPLGKTHSGGCYGKSGPFVPQTIRK